MGLVTGLLDSTQLAAGQKDGLLKAIRDKNAHGLRQLCKEYGVGPSLTEKLASLAVLYGPFEETLAAARALSVNDTTDAALQELEQLYRLLKLDGCGDHINLDFSVVNDLSYYNGLIFRGFIDGLPLGVLSGGRYDNLLKKFGKKGGAIGFAVYLDLLERLDVQEPPYDVDVLLLYNKDTDVADLAAAVKAITEAGESIRVQRADDGRLKYRRLLQMNEGRAVTVGNA
jgi:ATP phosphoribosyltransferase regulatory subunit